MTDFDIFRTKVPRAWGKTSRLVFAPDLSPDAVDAACNAGAVSLKQHGCAALPEFLRMLAKVRADADMRSCSAPMHTIENIQRRHPEDITQLAAEVMKTILSFLEIDPETAEQVDDLAFARRCIVRLVLNNVAAPGLQAVLQECGGWSARAIEVRLAEFRDALSNSPGVDTLARQLIDDPSGGTVKVLKKRRPKQDQESLLYSFALTPADSEL